MVIAAVEDKDIDSTIESLDPATLDVLMKYIYQGLQSPDNAASLLKWHAKTLSMTGNGCIVRVMVDRKTVW